MNSITRIALKLLAIYWLGVAIYQIPQVIAGYYNVTHQHIELSGFGWVFFVLIAVGLAIFAGVILWRVANSITVDTSGLSGNDEGKLQPPALERAAIIGVGLLLLSWSVPHLPYTLFDVWKIWQIFDKPGALSFEETGWIARLVTSIASQLATMALGGWLALTPSRMQRLIKAFDGVRDPG